MKAIKYKALAGLLVFATLFVSQTQTKVSIAHHFDKSIQRLAETTIFSENFDQAEVGAEAGRTGSNPFVVSEDKQAMIQSQNSQGYDYYPDITNVEGNFEMSVDATFSGEGNFFFWFNVFGLVEGDGAAVEFTVHYDNGNVDSYAKGIGLSEQITGAIPTISKDTPFSYKVRRVGTTLSLFCNDALLLNAQSDSWISNVDQFNIGVFEIGAGSIVKFDNLLISKYITEAEVSTVTISTKTDTISTMKSTVINASYTPDDANVKTIEWLVNDAPVAGAGTLKYVFHSEEVGQYKIKCRLNDVSSNELTITVVEASEEEKNSLFYEDFNVLADDTPFGSFKVKEGAIVPTANYSRYDFPEAVRVKNLDMSLDVTITGTSQNNSYLGFTVTGIDEDGAEAEFNFVDIAEKTTETGEAEDNEEITPVDGAIVKYAGTEKYFSFDNAKGGVGADIPTYEVGTTYHFQVIRYEDQFEIRLNHQPILKYYLLNPTIPSNVFLYTFNGDAVGAPLAIDNIMIKEAQEITDRVEPPVIPVTGGYITTSGIETAIGESVTLQAVHSPFDATVTSYQWYVNGSIIEGATEKTYVFTPTEAGEYTFKVLLNGEVETETKKITVTAAEDPIKDPDKKPSKVGLIVGLSVAAVAVAAAAVSIVLIQKKKSKTKK